MAIRPSPTPPLRTQEPPDFCVWSAIRDLSFDDRNSINASYCLRVLEYAVNLTSLSVVLLGNLNPAERPSFSHKEVVKADNLESLPLQTLSLQRNASRIRHDEEATRIGFEYLVERSRCHLQSLSLTNMFPSADELEQFLKLRNVDQLE
ncbi:hypothetical protein C0989_006423 [Termitomyces sp. Mn162]|nr:hypothetical protein C0989_006423 [Termitomyces sp. Mn162]